MTLALTGLSGLGIVTKVTTPTAGAVQRLNDVVYSVSELYSTEPGLQPTFDNLNDGSPNTGAATAFAANAWIKADVGSVKFIHKVRISSGILPGGWQGIWDYLENAEIQTSLNDSPGSWTTVHQVAGLPLDDATINTQDYLINANTRYISLNISNNWLATAEFSVYTN